MATETGTISPQADILKLLEEGAYLEAMATWLVAKDSLGSDQASGSQVASALNDLFYRAKDIVAVNVSVKLVHSEGGREGEGSQVDRVYLIKTDEVERFVRTTGFYDSYNGTEWDGSFERVYPQRYIETRYIATQKPDEV